MGKKTIRRKHKTTIDNEYESVNAGKKTGCKREWGDTVDEEYSTYCLYIGG